MKLPTFRPGLLLAFTLLAGAHVGAQADGGGRLMPRNAPPAYQQECGSCHTAYSPALLPAPSWQRIMSGLDKHYGTDASLDDATVRQLSAWLQANAGTYKRVREQPPQDRITRSAWFAHKHDEVDPRVWKLPSVKSAANCAACHPGADRGDFNEHNIRAPAGMDARMRRTWDDD